MHEGNIEPLVIGLGGTGRGKSLHAASKLSTEQWLPELKPEEVIANAIVERLDREYPRKVTLKENEVLDASEIPPERMKLMQAKYQEFKKKWPKMKDARIVRKVAEYFKVKLV